MTMNFDNSTIGKDVEALCSKCGQSWHVISAVFRGKIDDVECKGCNNHHKYRPVPAANRTLQKDTRTALVDENITSKLAPKSKSTTTTVRSSSPNSTSSTPDTRAAAAEAARSTKSSTSKKTYVEPLKVSPNNKEIQNYSIKTPAYDIGDRILHPKFGMGVVEEFPEANKMWVYFSEQRVLLVYGK